MEVIIRELRKDEYPQLTDFLYEAIFVPPGTPKPERAVVHEPELQVYVENFGTGIADFALAAEVEGGLVGCAWTRIMNDYGHLDEQTPSLAIAVFEQYRGRGIGTKLLKTLLIQLQESGYSQVSLSVQKANYAAQLYQKLGFQIVKENAEEWIMAVTLNPKKKETL